MSFEIERARAALLERLRRNIENSDDAEQEAVRALGDQLYHVPRGTIATYGTQKWDPKKARTSWDPDAAAGVPEPGRNCQSIAAPSLRLADCFWLLDELDALRSRLKTSGFWVPSEKLKGIRILGRHPIDAVHDRRVADIFAASFALYPAGQPFDNLLSDMSPEALKSYVNRVTNLHRDLVSPNDHQKARQILIDLVEENIGELEELLVQHFEKDRNKAQRTIDYHGFDESRTGDGIRRHWLRFRESLERGKKTFLKYDERQGGGRAGKGDQRAQDAHAGAVDRGADGTRSVLATGSGTDVGSRGADGTLSVPATGNGRDDCGSDALVWPQDAALTERKATLVEIHLSDISACGGFLPERVHDLNSQLSALDGQLSVVSGPWLGTGDGDGGGLSGTETPQGDGDGGALFGSHSRDGDSAALSDPGGPPGDGDDAGLSGPETKPGDWDCSALSGPAADCGGEAASREEDEARASGDLTSAHAGADSGNRTNEAKLGADVSTSELKEAFEVMADSGVEAGLDSLRTKPELAVLNSQLSALNSQLSVVRCRWLGTGDGGGGGLIGPETPPGDGGGGGLFRPVTGGWRRWWVVWLPLGDGDGVRAATLGRCGGGGTRPAPEMTETTRCWRWSGVIYKQLESLMAAGVPTDDLLTEMMAASAELHAQLEQEQPRGP